MTLPPQQLRLDGIYQQPAPDRFMQRIKVPAGALSSEQALKVAELAGRYAGGRLHLTTRGSIELHDVAGADLAEVNRGMAAVGLTGRGACGGAVRGIACSTTAGIHYDRCQALARRLHRHFVGNPWFEGLPKKFKIGVDGDEERGRHLIQDLGLVFAGLKEGTPLWDVWCAGGLGREPRPAFLLANRVPEERVIPLVEAVLRVYAAQAPAGRRLKFVLAEIGEENFRDLLRAETGAPPRPQFDRGLGKLLTAERDDRIEPLTARVFAGELAAGSLRLLAVAAQQWAGGTLLLSADQDLAFLPDSAEARTNLAAALAAAGFDGRSPEQQVCFRVCPGSHECRMGLAPTRDLARQLIAGAPLELKSLSWAISGCPNSCSQPQLADIGIVTSRAGKDQNGQGQPRFDLYQRTAAGFGKRIAPGLSAVDLTAEISRLSIPR
ncbi:nitrite/sulfite reductase domain-containing protein [Desulfuromonas sp. DDH964]|uniref:nitrite/sulfite reductase n=1 Tax=Desulfuromonas sp. DDH964 TaxID=1823759 RepID=UPI00078D1505|nr:nitrite/sulfite reductase [Desulfuromonas sp. DDH964]AMV73587.1 nitrite/sulfite reductase domain-containing protein [Desulfuromonas sp. DDH964]